MDLPSGTVTLLFTDIEGSTALWEAHRDEMERVLGRHDELLRSAIEGSGGYVFKTVGDAFCATFSKPEEAIAAALEAQMLVAVEAWGDPLSLRVRMALHTGVCQERDGDYFGPAVNRAARLEAIAHGGQILLSEATAGLVKQILPEGCALVDLGEHRLKDLGLPEHVFQLSADGLETKFPPLRSLDNPELEHNLPIQLTSFIGREKELSEIHRLVDGSRLVTLTGSAGSGKTRLALQVAADLLDGSGDGVWLVDLSPLSAEEQVAREVAGVLGVREEASRPLLETLVESLQFRSVLVVLDNCEQVIDAVAKLAETTIRRCPKLWVLATSREPLGLEGERVYRVPPLGLPDDVAELNPEAVAGAEAVRLFVERAREHRPDFSLGPANVATVVSLCRHLDGIPLALELAAARVRSMSIDDIERHLSQRFKLLSARSRMRAARQQTLEAAVAWSYELLHETERLVFSCLSVFPGTFDLSAAESVCAKAAGLDEFEVVDMVESLVDKSLLQAEQGASGLGYRMFETLAQYAADRLADIGPDGTDRVREAHASHYLGFVEEAASHLTGSDQVEWIQKLETNYDNIRAALAYFCASPGHGQRALRMVGAFHIFWWVMLGGTQGEARDLALAALAHPDPPSATKERSAALLSLGCVEDNMGKLVAARATDEEGLAIAREIGDAALVAEHLESLAHVYMRLGDLGRAHDAAAEALEMAASVGDANLQAGAQLRMAPTLVDDPDAARQHFAEALRLYKHAGNRWQISVAYNNLGNLEMIVGDVAAARSSLEAALEQPATPDTRAVALMNLGLVSVLEGNLEAARANYVDTLRRTVRVGSFGHVPYALLGLALCSDRSGSPEQSAVLHGAADAMVEAQGWPWEPAEAGLREKDLAALRRQMGEAAFEAAYSRGHEMNGADAIALALGVDEQQTGV